MKIEIPELSLVVLMGPSGSGKSSFARKHFKPTEVLSSDECRGLVSDDENNQAATNDAFDVLYYIAKKRLAAGRITVIDATNVQPEARKNAVALAREFHVLPVAVVFDVPERICHDRNKTREDRNFGPHVIRQQMQQLHRSLGSLQREGFRHVFKLQSVADVDAAEVARVPLWNNRKFDHGPFDVIGDVHGCLDELEGLLGKLGYTRDAGGVFRHEQGRKAVFLGDLVDRGPNVAGVLRTAMSMEKAGTALCVPGNHELKLLRKLRGKDVKLTHGLAQTLEQLEREPAEFRDEVARFIDDQVSHYVLDDGKLVVAHAGMKEVLQGRGSGKVREFALYGETTGETDEYGLPVRYPWANEYRGTAAVVYGHTPVPEAEWLNNTICIDTGCVYGGKLTGLRWPEREIVQVPAAKVYCESIRPLAPVDQQTALSAQHANDDVLDLADVFGKRIIETRLHRNVTVREENSVAALEAMSRFAANPRWLVYLPPTMSPPETSRRPGLLEHPDEAFAYFRREGVVRVVCEEKHMGSRAVVVACRDAAVAKTRFGVATGEAGAVVTRTGRRFFTDSKIEMEFIGRLRTALDKSGFWDEHKTDWALLDCELMPWSVKAQDLIRDQYAAVGAASRAALADAMPALDAAAARGVDVGDLLLRTRERTQLVGRYVEAYRRYCWPVQSLDDLKLAPFHILATEGAVHTDKNHDWHMQVLAKVCAADPKMLLATPYRVVALDEPDAVNDAVRWWEDLTARGGEGVVVKPLDFVVRGSRGLVQPAVKCRGTEYLRIIYGPEYSVPENLDRLRTRGLGVKRSLALREFALGVEALERFVRRDPLRRVHECVFGVLALESEPVDPRL
jgi:polynucleotide kinase-phosphatase